MDVLSREPVGQAAAKMRTVNSDACPASTSLKAAPDSRRGCTHQLHRGALLHPAFT